MNKLTISLSAIAENYKLLSGKANCAAVVKANGYGLGASPIAKKLAAEGCKTFFVATTEEGIALRKALPENEIYVFHGAQQNEVAEFERHNLTPVLNNPGQLVHWPKDKPCAAQFDTGMTRLGFKPEDAGKLKDYKVKLVMSHLANADEGDNEINHAQLDVFNTITPHFPKAIKSLANSSGIFLGKAYHFDIARPGIALYGGNPVPYTKNPMNKVVGITAPIIQIHEISGTRRIGYGGDYEAQEGDIIATIPVGYADGILRKLGNRGVFYCDNHELPIVGRVSMDLITIKINNLPPERRKLGEMVDILGNNYNITDMARDAETIDYEIITRLGNRFERIYV